MKSSCPRLFEAEAWRDGRLSGPEAARFQAHAGGCAACTRELQSLQALADALAAPIESAPDELHVRRERTRLLAAFDARLVPAVPQRFAKLRWGFAPAALACSALVLVLASGRRAPQQAAAVSTAVGPSPGPSPEPISIRADSGAKWSRKAQDQVETIRLEAGALSIRVDHTTAARRLLVILPDGELEDVGTTFSVSADAGRTTHVSVQEGRVILRLQDESPRTLGAGESWSPPPSPSPSASVAPPSPQLAERRAPARAIAVASTNGVRAPTAPDANRDAAAEFRAAMTAFDGGDNARAATLFSAFVSAHPGDSRGEDAAYLRVLALQRSGRAGAMRQAATEYLRRYPRGFRKAEIDALMR
jgi:hypothetical protein